MGCNFLVFKLKERVSLSIFYKMCVCHYNFNREKWGIFILEENAIKLQLVAVKLDWL